VHPHDRRGNAFVSSTDDQGHDDQKIAVIKRTAAKTQQGYIHTVNEFE
jgi:hypothetical protein